MRLEDWQKFIESEFLDESASPAAPAPAPPKAPAETKTAAVAVIEDKGDTRPASVEKTAVQPSICISPSFLTTSSQFSKSPVPPPPPKPEPTPIRSPFVPIALTDDDIPEIGTYLPAFAVTHVPAETQAEPEIPPAQVAFAVETVIDTPQPVEPLPASPPAKRIPKSRARHLRKTESDEEVPSNDIPLVELWAGVPKHLETLLALARHDEEEIAQFSYKSPFMEKRRELISRLLDPELSLEEAARLLCVCPTTIRRYTNRGILRCFRKEVANGHGTSAAGYDTRPRRFRLSDILRFLETQGDLLDKDRRHDAKTLFATANPSAASAALQGDS